MIGLKNDGLKEILGMWINETESASFWLSVLTDLKARGVQDILIACTDNLTAFTKAIAEVFPATITSFAWCIKSGTVVNMWTGRNVKHSLLI